MIIYNSQLTTGVIDSLNRLVDLEMNIDCAIILVPLVREISRILDEKNNMEKLIYREMATETGDIPDEHMDDFRERLNDIMNIEHEINYDRIPFSQLGIDKISIGDVMNLEFLFG